MSGTLQHRVNKIWNKETVAYPTSVVFWHFLNFFNDHPSFSFVGYGNGKSQAGTTPPSAWFDWDPTVLATSPYSENSWFVINADLASKALDESGDFQWQAKFQLSMGSGFDDCNVADVDYGWEGTVSCVCVRASAMGGWNATTLDFSPTGGEAVSNNLNIFQNVTGIFGLDIIGDNDTIFWRGAACASSLPTNGPFRSRSGYLGMVQRLHSAIEYPFLFVAGRIYDETANGGYRSVNWCYDNNNTYYAWKRGYQYWDGASYSWPSYSVWKNGSSCTTQKIDTWGNSTTQSYFTADPLGNPINCAMKISQWKAPNKYGILGELRLVAKIGYQYNHGVRYGDNNEWLQFCLQGQTYSGVGMRWPISEPAPIW
jgi:hypothetical protein